MKNDHKKSNSRRETTGMLARYALSALASGVLLCATVANAQSTNANSLPSFDSFDIISSRNIFDPNRRAFRRYERAPSHTPDVVALVGTMSYTKGKFAFFDGTKSDYKKVLEPGAIIAGYTIKDITPKDVTLAANGKEMTLNVGTQMQKDGGNDWTLSKNSDLPSAADTNTGSAGSASDQSVPSGTSPAANDIIKRLMEQRQQLLK
jgi:hypothetical protein